MTEQAATSPFDDVCEVELSIDDWIKFVADDCEQATEGKTADEVRRFCRSIRNKLDEIETDPVDDDDDPNMDVPFPEEKDR